jgi:hypothetical protein
MHALRAPKGQQPQAAYFCCSRQRLLRALQVKSNREVDSQNARLWNGRLWREADIRRSGQVRKVPIPDLPMRLLTVQSGLSQIHLPSPSSLDTALNEPRVI